MSVTERKPAKPNEVLVSAFVDISDFLNAVPKEELEQILNNISFKRLEDMDNKAVIGELKRRLNDEENDLTEEDIIDKLDLHLEDGNAMESLTSFESLQHQQLHEEFEQARKNINPSKLFDIFAKLNRPAIAPGVLIIR